MWAHLLVFVCVCTAHICMVDPPQRGPQPTGGPGDHACYRRTPYCGGIPTGAPSRTFLAGHPATIVFQQNFNHWYTPKPGYVDVAIAAGPNPRETDFTVLKRYDDFPAHEMVYQTDFAADVVMPPHPCEHCIIRVRYVTNNPMEVDPKNNTDAIFYNCADVRVVASPTTFTPPPPEAPARPQGDVSCTTPASWVAEAIETRRDGVVQHRFFWDGVGKRVRWDRFGDGHQGTKQNLTLITPYLEKPEPEYMYYGDSDTCRVTGPDAWYPWAYGEAYLQMFQREITLPNSATGLEWISRDKRTTYVATKLPGGICTPYAQHHEGSAMFFTEVKAVQPDSSVFDVPAACKKL